MSNKFVIILGLIFFVAVLGEGARSRVAIRNRQDKRAPCSNSTHPGNKMAPCSQSNETDASPESLNIIPCMKRMRTLSNIDSIVIPGCSKYPCLFKRGDSSKIQVAFTPLYRIRAMQLSIAGIIQGSSVDFPLDDQNHCQTSVVELASQNATRCALNRNTQYNYEFSLPILKSYPPMPLNVRYEVKQFGRSLFCFLLPIRIV
ncbi:ecdysteroid-regulated 16 kDa -like [Brachionus plicatilis]|uniref:Ecdysteroid-regulated 16 kDa-like n=1 Tax=Brachionus plicatilis TaxID=10195 RepID=A0A3M7RTQ7_BRAPC|nr:ecdysteroid-regulated 16 kDa -like [Brachionus plicatilis]